MRQFSVTLLLMFVATLAAQSSHAFVEFHKQWVAMYIDENDDSEATKEYIKLVAKGKYRCLVCHQGKKKTNHNPYGDHFVGVIGKDDKKDDEKIIKVLTEVGKLPFDPEADPDAEDTVTYNDRIAEKKFPGGELEELEAEPEEEETEQ
jgi:hypothetical protein